MADARELAERAASDPILMSAPEIARLGRLVLDELLPERKRLRELCNEVIDDIEDTCDCDSHVASIDAYRESLARVGDTPQETQR